MFFTKFLRGISVFKQAGGTHSTYGDLDALSNKYCLLKGTLSYF